MNNEELKNKLRCYAEQNYKVAKLLDWTFEDLGEVVIRNDIKYRKVLLNQHFISKNNGITYHLKTPVLVPFNDGDEVIHY